MIAPADPAKVVALARGWLGTPYHHGASNRGAGTDCLGLVRGVWRELNGIDAEMPPAYSPAWRDCGDGEPLLEAAARHLIPAGVGPDAGDVVLFRLRRDARVKHAAILVSPTRMIHAQEGVPVSEVGLGPWWQRRIAGVFRFPLLVSSTR
ncbi:MAG: NlpC/P60 family protein [Hyphomicrobiaceae bacterium]